MLQVWSEDLDSAFLASSQGMLMHWSADHIAAARGSGSGSQCGHGPSSMELTWEIVRNANSQALDF